ncbi:hypothetical protein HPP92_029075 [Vanilla planifolia]|uniref:Uncharacterized protein n=1 Tax=Vanilla planifolia TaxID=51239 RepID=A0A835P590_VANPL|nr:hypothetical protein HPP92_029064 [Vanilla planifolia]KAG0445964.1 hypothetical protein HPP92_029075 [Vanilla planifolia]
MAAVAAVGRGCCGKGYGKGVVELSRRADRGVEGGGRWRINGGRWAEGGIEFRA